MGLIDGFVLGRVIAQSRGIEDAAAANRIGLVAGATGGGSQSLVIAAVLAQQAAASAPAGAPPAGVSVPPLVGTDFAEKAEPALKALGLTATRQDVDSTTAPIGAVVSQSPSPGSVVAVGSAVTLAVSRGVSMPGVVGRQLDEATSQLEALGLEVQANPDGKAAAAAGTVTDQDPEAGTLIAPGRTVTLSVSGVQVRDVTGELVTEATATLEAQGLKLNVATTVSSSSVTAPVVADQSPEANTVVAAGSVIDVTVLDPAIQVASRRARSAQA